MNIYKLIAILIFIYILLYWYQEVIFDSIISRMLSGNIEDVKNTDIKYGIPRVYTPYNINEPIDINYSIPRIYTPFNIKEPTYNF